MAVLATSVGLLKPDVSASYSYPTHIEGLAALPRRPGVYLFEDERGRPLYIGKSVDIRSRVLAHLRNPDEARLLQQTRHVDFRPTAGEIGALLLESRLIKDLQPVHNKKLRRSREMCAFQLRHGMPVVVYARELDFSIEPDLYGLFATRRAAQERLRLLVDAHRLCPALCGLESRAAGRACFARQLGRCVGACAGRESRALHAQRLLEALAALRVITWPYPGAIGIVETCEGWSQMHVVDHWFYLGTVEKPFASAAARLPRRKQFDVDTYAILVKPLLVGELEIVPLRRRAGVDRG